MSSINWKKKKILTDGKQCSPIIINRRYNTPIDLDMLDVTHSDDVLVKFWKRTDLFMPNEQNRRVYSRHVLRMLNDHKSAIAIVAMRLNKVGHKHGITIYRDTAAFIAFRGEKTYKMLLANPKLIPYIN